MKMYKLYKHRHKTLLLLIHCHHPPPPSVSLWSTGRANKSAAPSRKGEEEWHSGNDDTEVRAESWGRTQRAMLAKGAVGPASGRWFLAQFTVQREEKPFPRPPPPPARTLHGTSKILLTVHMVPVLPLSSSLFVMVASRHHSLLCALPRRAWWWGSSPPSYILNNFTSVAMR